MSNIIISKEAINDILTGHADYIKQKKMFYDNIYFDNKGIVFGKGKKKLAEVKIPDTVNFSQGDTITIQFDGSMPIFIIPAK
jgi:hypothetical protein